MPPRMGRDVMLSLWVLEADLEKWRLSLRLLAGRRERDMGVTSGVAVR